MFAAVYHGRLECKDPSWNLYTGKDIPAQPYDAKLISLIDDDKDRTVSQNTETESKKVRYILLLSHDRRNDRWMEKASLKKRSTVECRV